jgi:hypothetical protein
MTAIRQLMVLVIALVTLSVMADENQDFSMAVTQSDKAFFQQIKKAIATNDFIWLSKAVSYPLDVQLANKVLHLANEADFKKNARTILTEQLKSVVNQQPADSLFKNWQGVMIGRGQIWFTQVGEESGKGQPLIWVYKIVAFNLDAPEGIVPNQSKN